MTTPYARQNWVLAVAIVLASLILGVSFGARTAAQPKVEQPAAVGRYQMQYSTTNGMFEVTDTTTGQCWSKSEPTDEWRDYGSPARGKK
jgi:hypothetical protein